MLTPRVSFTQSQRESSWERSESIKTQDLAFFPLVSWRTSCPILVPLDQKEVLPLTLMGTGSGPITGYFGIASVTLAVLLLRVQNILAFCFSLLNVSLEYLGGSDRKCLTFVNGRRSTEFGCLFLFPCGHWFKSPSKTFVQKDMTNMRICHCVNTGTKNYLAAFWICWLIIRYLHLL